MAKTKYGNLIITRTVFGTPIEIGVTEDEVLALYDEVCRRSRDRHLGTVRAMVRDAHKEFPKMPNEHKEAKE